MTKCNICDNKIENIFTSNLNLSVSSDNKVVNKGFSIYKCTSCSHLQKIENKDMLTVYETYKKDDLVDGQDQIKFINGKPSFRTDILIKTILDKLENKKTLLDIGTGTGVFLRSCNNYLNLNMSAFDVNSRQKENILNIPNVNNFYTNSLQNITSKFDIISMIHVFEHIQKPLETLNILKNMLNKDGVIIIQVPSIIENPNDILIYDHYSHFTQSALFLILKKVFSNVEFIKTDIKNELTVLVTNDDKTSSFTSKEEDLEFLFLNSVNDYLKNLNENIYIFGTAPTSTYYASILKDKPNFKGFLDEDMLKENKFHLDKQIFHPKNRTNINCFIPLSSNISDYIKEKYKEINFITIEDIHKK